MAVVKGFERCAPHRRHPTRTAQSAVRRACRYAGSKTTVRIVNPVESITRARAKSDARTVIIKNQASAHAPTTARPRRAAPP